VIGCAATSGVRTESDRRRGGMVEVWPRPPRTPCCSARSRLIFLFLSASRSLKMPTGLWGPQATSTQPDLSARPSAAAPRRTWRLPVRPAIRLAVALSVSTRSPSRLRPRPLVRRRHDCSSANDCPQFGRKSFPRRRCSRAQARQRIWNLGQQAFPPDEASPEIDLVRVFGTASHADKPDLLKRLRAPAVEWWVRRKVVTTWKMFGQVCTMLSILMTPVFRPSPSTIGSRR